MMNQKILYGWMEHPERLDRDTLYELRTLLARYPYFQTARLLYLKNLFCCMMSLLMKNFDARLCILVTEECYLNSLKAFVEAWIRWKNQEAWK